MLVKYQSTYCYRFVSNVRDHDTLYPGIPFLVQAIVATEQATYPVKAAAGPNLARAVKSLFRVARGDSLDGRIHAYNILRALFRDNRLGEAVGQFVEEGIVMAIKGFKSAKWAVRDIGESPN